MASWLFKGVQKAVEITSGAREKVYQSAERVYNRQMERVSGSTPPSSAFVCREKKC